MFKSHFPAVLKVQTMFTPIFGPDKHTSEVRIRVKTKLIFLGYIYCQNNQKKKVGEK